MYISTKKGDHGFTDVKEGRISKNDPRIRALGQIDETIACILQADLKCDIPYCRNIIDNLSAIAAEIAGYNSVFDEKLIEKLECAILEKEEHFTFVYPYKNEEKILLNICRVKVRTLERELVAIENCSEIFLSFINRLSDYFYVKML